MKNKYFINGSVAQQVRIQQLFQSIRLNINNPQFLIMQGKITKVCNMKPSELLAMLEETAGTKMYENTRTKSLKLLQAKELKLQEINDTIRNDIHNRIMILQEEKSIYVQYHMVKRELDNIKRVYAILLNTKYKRTLNKYEQESIDINKQIDTIDIDINDINKNILNIEEEIIKLQDIYETDEEKTLLNEKNTYTRPLASIQVELNDLQNLKITKKSDLDLLNNKLTIIKDKYNDSTIKHHTINKELHDKRIEQKDSIALLNSLKDTINGTKSSYITTLNNQLLQQNNEKLKNDTQINTINNDIKILNNKLNQIKSNIDNEYVIYNKIQDTIKKKYILLQENEKQLIDYEKYLEINIHKYIDIIINITTNTILKDKIKELKTITIYDHITKKPYNFDDTIFFIIKKELNILKRQLYENILVLQDNIERIENQIRNRINFQYIISSQISKESIDNKIYGPLAKLFTIKNVDTIYALEIAAGSRLYNIVVEDHNTATQLLKYGNLANRITFIPLNKITSKIYDNNTYERIITPLLDNRANLAIDIINYDKNIKNAIEYVYGTTFICNDKEIAQTLTYNNAIRSRSVTLDGDLYEPSGLLTGGSKQHINNSILQLLYNLNTIKNELKNKQNCIETLQELNNVIDTIEKYCISYNDIYREYQRINDNLLNSLYMQYSKEKDTIIHSLNDKNDILNTYIKQDTNLLNKIKQINDLLQDNSNDTNLQDKITKYTIDIKSLEDDITNKESTITQIEAYEEQYLDEIKQLNTNIDDINNKLNSIDNDINTKLIDQNIYSNKIDIINKKLKDIQNTKLNINDQIIQIKNQRQILKDNLKKYICKKDNLINDNNIIKQNINKIKQDIDILIKKELWLNNDKEINTIDVNTITLEQAEKRTQELTDEFNKLTRRVNINSITQYEKMETEYRILQKKRDQLLKDKTQIETMIKDLDVKRNEAVLNTWETVSKNFNSIFSTLLPDTQATLNKIEKDGLIVGITMLVAFGGVWKNSLTELSGGQRSLLALSYILALLLYKPSPMYILDEIDAALDLSHTQNIGAVIRKHFSMSQFIIVSLKEGMFNNSNVLFRTRFQDGVSGISVIRTDT